MRLSSEEIRVTPVLGGGHLLWESCPKRRGRIDPRLWLDGLCQVKLPVSLTRFQPAAKLAVGFMRSSRELPLGWQRMGQKESEVILLLTEEIRICSAQAVKSQ